MYNNKFKGQKVVTILSILIIISSFILGSGQFLEAKAYSSEPIIFALVGPMTGPSSEWGEAMRDGATIAVEEINQAGGVLGRKLEFIIEDDKGEPREAVTVAQKIVNNPNVVGVVGNFFSSCTFAAGPIYQQEGVPTLATAATHPDIPKIGDYIFRANPRNTAQGAGIIDFCLEVLGKKNIAILYPADDYGRGMFVSASERAKERGVNVVYQASHKTAGELDFTALLTSVRSAGADVLVLASFYTQAAQIVRQMKLVGFDVPVVGADSLYQPGFIEIGGASAEGVYVATWFHPEGPLPETKLYVETYKARFNKTVNISSPFIYDAVKILAGAIERAGTTDGEAVRDEIAKTDYMGPTGPVTFNEYGGRNIKDLKGLFVQVVDGKFKLLDY